MVRLDFCICLTAEMQKDKTFMFGGSVLNPETLPSKEWWGNYYTFNYYLNITIFPWLEVGYNCVLVKGNLESIIGRSRLMGSLLTRIVHFMGG